jgi:hypothetical protein
MRVKFGIGYRGVTGKLQMVFLGYVMMAYLTKGGGAGGPCPVGGGGRGARLALRGNTRATWM